MGHEPAVTLLMMRLLTEEWINCEVNRAIHSARIQPSAAKPVGQRFVAQTDNEPSFNLLKTEQ